MRAESPVRYGILGFGNHGMRRLVPGFALAKASVLYGIWRRDAKKAEANARDLNLPCCFASAEALCTSPEIDAVFVTSPDVLHRPHVLLALSAGKAVLCEKPLGMNAGEVEEMLAAAQHAQVLFGVAQNFRFSHSLRLIREWIAEGRIGKPVLAHAQFCYDAAQVPRSWIYNPEVACGGPIGDVGIHCLDALRFVLDDDVNSVATVATSDAKSGQVESNASIGLAFSKGTVGSVTVTARAPFRHTLIEVVGDEGVVKCENCLNVDRPVEVVWLRGGKVAEQRQVSNSDAYGMMIDAFSVAFHGTESYSASGEDGLRNQRILDAAYTSLRQGQTQQLVTLSPQYNMYPHGRDG
jgi:predicted dehydrogenase